MTGSSPKSTRPTSGMSLSNGMCTAATPTPGMPTKALPTRADRPRPNSVRASPEATWFATKTMVTRPNSAAINAPAPMAARMPTNARPVSLAAAKPHAAPTAIIPSTPRLRTPERSPTSSPSAAIRSGVEAARRVMRGPSSPSMTGLGESDRRRPRDPDAVGDERVAGEHEEQEHALEDSRGLVGQVERALSPLTAQERQSEHQAGHENADRIEPPKEGDNDGREAIAGRHGGAELTDGP